MKTGAEDGSPFELAAGCAALVVAAFVAAAAFRPVFVGFLAHRAARLTGDPTP